LKNPQTALIVLTAETNIVVDLRNGERELHGYTYQN